jgi:hypothetical protein
MQIPRSTMTPSLSDVEVAEEVDIEVAAVRE